jgi:hypothetical protein
MTNMILNLNSIQLCQFTIDTNIKMRLEKYNSSLATIYFTDDLLNKISIPSKIHMQTYDAEVKDIIICKPINENSYIICITDDYEVFYKEFSILYIESQKCWKLCSSLRDESKCAMKTCRDSTITLSLSEDG